MAVAMSNGSHNAVCGPNGTHHLHRLQRLSRPAMIRGAAQNRRGMQQSRCRIGNGHAQRQQNQLPNVYANQK